MEDKKNLKKLKYVTFGSPIMDLIVDVDKEFIKKYGLKLDTTYHAVKESRVFQAVESRKPKWEAGGCSFNAIRIFNWMLKDTDEFGKVGGLGSVGNDFWGNEFRELLKAEKIKPLLEVFDGEYTARCATICEGRERCHVTDLGASTLISEDFIEKNWKELKDLSLVYTELYILDSKAGILKKFAELCLDDKKLFGFNFPSICFLESFSKEIIEMISYGDILFANKEEARHFVSKVLKFDYADVSDLPIILAKLPKKNKNKKRVFVVTCGPDPAHVAVYNHETDKLEFSGSFMPFNVPKENIIDTNGAGDSFAGGFLAYYSQGYKIETCVKAGHWAAKQTIQKRGFQVNINDEVPTEEDLLNMSLNDFDQDFNEVDGRIKIISDIEGKERKERKENQEDIIEISKNNSQK